MRIRLNAAVFHGAEEGKRVNKRGQEQRRDKVDKTQRAANLRAGT